MALITAQQVIDYSFTNANTKATLIKDAYIFAAEHDYLKPAIGEDLYNAIVTEKDSTWTGLNQTLYETYLIKALAFYVKLLVLPDLNINTSNAGLMVNSTEFSSQATSSQRAELAESTRKMASIFIKGALSYIETHKESFTTYYQDDSDTRVTTKNYGGFVI